MKKSTSNELFLKLQNSHKILHQIKPYWSILPTVIGEPHVQYVIKFYIINQVHEYFKKHKEAGLIQFLKVLAEEIQEIKNGISRVSNFNKYDNINRAVFLSVQLWDEMYEATNYSKGLIER